MNELYHYGRKGMKWGQHIFGKDDTVLEKGTKFIKKVLKTPARLTVNNDFFTQQRVRDFIKLHIQEHQQMINDHINNVNFHQDLHNQAVNDHWSSINSFHGF